MFLLCVAAAGLLDADSAEPAPFTLGGRSRAVSAGFDPALGPPFAVRERMSQGREDAPIVIIEFSSFSCSHCRKFHEREFPSLKERFVDMGEVRWVNMAVSPDQKDKESPLYLAARGAMKAGKYPELEDVLFEEGDKAFPIVRWALMREGNLTRGEITAWAEDEKNRQAVEADFAEFAAMKFRGTPTFVLRKRKPNGVFVSAVITGYRTADTFVSVIGELQKQ